VGARRIELEQPWNEVLEVVFGAPGRHRLEEVMVELTPELSQRRAAQRRAVLKRHAVCAALEVGTVVPVERGVERLQGALDRSRGLLRPGHGERELIAGAGHLHLKPAAT